MALAWQARGMGPIGDGCLAFSCTHPVILTEVRIQDYGRPASWLWILTFVRMTELGVR